MARDSGVRSTIRRRALKTGSTAVSDGALEPRRKHGSLIRRAVSVAAMVSLLSAGPAGASETRTYVYDPLGRLVVVNHAGTVNNGATACYSYDPASNRSNVTASTAVITCATGQGTGVTFSISSDGAVTEGGTAVFTVTKAGTYAGTLTINYATADGTAVAGSDYNAASGSVTFGPTDTTKTISVTTINDTFHENTETFTITLTNPTGGGVLASASGTINDDDAANQPPVTQADSLTLPCNETSTVNVTANDSDPEGNYPLTVTAVTSVPRADATVISASTVQVVAGNPGTATLTYTVQDSLGNPSTGTINVTVQGTLRACGG